MGFRDRFRKKPQAQEKQKSGSTWSVETGGHKFALHREKHYVARNNDTVDHTSARPALPPRPNTTYTDLAPPPLPPRSISQQSAPAVLQHRSQNDSGTVQRNTNFLAQCLSVLVGMVVPQKQKPNSMRDGQRSPSDSGKVWKLAFLMGFASFALALRYTFVPLSTALGIGGFAYAATAIFLHWLNSQDRRHEITITAQKEVMLAMVEKGHGQPYTAAMTSGFLETSGSRTRLLDYD